MGLKYLSIEEVKEIHDLLIDQFGGLKGVRSENLLDSAVSRMSVSFDGRDLYKTVYEKAAALFQSLCKNHPFVDGNKRSAFVCAVTFLEINGYLTEFDQKEAEKFVIGAAKRKTEMSEIVRFF